MGNNIEKIKSEIEARLTELANIQPKNDALKYLKKCEETYRAYYITVGAVSRHYKNMDEKGIMCILNDVLKKVEEVLKEDF